MFLLPTATCFGFVKESSSGWKQRRTWSTTCIQNIWHWHLDLLQLFNNRYLPCFTVYKWVYCHLIDI